MDTQKRTNCNLIIFTQMLAEIENELFVQNMNTIESNTVTRLSCKDLSHHFARPHMCTNKCEQRKKKMLLVIRIWDV